MVKIKPIASSSSGNCYFLSDGKTPLLLEAGISISKIKKALAYKLHLIQGCLISHAHLDHSRDLDGVLKAGINSYMSKGTAEALGLSGHRVKIVESKKQFQIGSWHVMPFDVIHDAPEPLGFILQSGQEKVLFLTDSAYTKYVIPGITHLMIECNYIPEILEENIANRSISKSRKKRLLFSHFSLENVIDFIKASDLSRLKETWLLHLSESNADPKIMKNEVQKITGKPVYIARR